MSRSLTRGVVTQGGTFSQRVDRARSLSTCSQILREGSSKSSFTYALYVTAQRELAENKLRGNLRWQ
jgi:hypothetical protein